MHHKTHARQLASKLSRKVGALKQAFTGACANYVRICIVGSKAFTYFGRCTATNFLHTSLDSVAANVFRRRQASRTAASPFCEDSQKHREYIGELEASCNERFAARMMLRDMPGGQSFLDHELPSATGASAEPSTAYGYQSSVASFV